MYTQLSSICLLALAAATRAAPAASSPPVYSTPQPTYVPPIYSTTGLQPIYTPMTPTTTAPHSSPPTPVAPTSIGIALSPDDSCTVVGGGNPGELETGVCYNTTSGIQSFEFYTPPSTAGTLYIYPEAGCGADPASFSLERLGCSGKLSVVGYSVKYDAGY